jgi:hypothetical protein
MIMSTGTDSCLVVGSANHMQPFIVSQAPNGGIRQYISSRTPIAIILTGIILFFSVINGSFASPSSTPDNDPYYWFEAITPPAPVLLSSTGDSFSIITRDATGITLDYGVTNVMAAAGSVPGPNEIYYSKATIKNDTNGTLEIDPSSSLGVFLWIYLQSFQPQYQTHAYYTKVLDEWILFKFDIQKPDGTTTGIAPYSTITDYSTTSNYHIPDAANMHVSPPISLEGDYYAKATLPIDPVELLPGESISISWWHGMAWEADNGTQAMMLDFNFRLRFKVKAPQPIEPVSIPVFPENTKLFVYIFLLAGLLTIVAYNRKTDI